MRVLVLNTAHTNQTSFDDRLGRLAAFMNEERPDFALLQEGAGGIASLWLYHCWSTLARLGNCLECYRFIDYKSFTTHHGFMEYRNGAFSLQPITGQHCIRTPKVSNEGARTATMVQAGPVQAVSVHLSSDCDDNGRLEEIRIILPHVTGAHALIGGDLNCGEGSAPWEAIRTAGFGLAGFGVDWLAVRGYKIIHVERVLPGISDHEGIMVTIL